LLEVDCSVAQTVALFCFLLQNQLHARPGACEIGDLQNPRARNIHNFMLNDVAFPAYVHDRLPRREQTSFHTASIKLHHLSFLMATGESSKRPRVAFTYFAPSNCR
jgi:hypothetical protein